MDSSAYNYADGAQGLVKIIDLVPAKDKDAAEEWAAYMHSITLTGNKKTADLLTEEDIEKDKKAIELLNKFPRKNHPPSDDFSSALVWGFMLYNESAITKKYWDVYVGKNNPRKAEYYDPVKYAGFITEIYIILSGKHPFFHDPLYHYTIDGENKKGVHVGYFDVMNSFRTAWNSHIFTHLARYMWRQEAKDHEASPTISIEASLENEDAGNHLAGEMSKNAAAVSSPEDEYDFIEVEDFLRSIKGSEWESPIVKNGVSYKDFVKALIGGVATSNAGFKKELGLNRNSEEKAADKVMKQMKKFGINIQTLSDYLSRYSTIAKDILEGKNVSFKDN